MNKWATIAALIIGTSLQAQSVTTTQNLGPVSAVTIANGLGENVFGNQAEFAAIKAMGGSMVRLQCAGWGAVEGQSAPPNNTSIGFTLPTNCANEATWAAQDGLNIQFVAAYGAPYHNILNLQTTASVAPGATTVPVLLTSAVGGDTWANVTPPNDYLYCATCLKTSGFTTDNVITGKRTYGGSLITGITVIDSTHATLTLSSAIVNTIASGTVLNINEVLWAHSANGYYASDQWLQKYALYIQNTTNAFLAITTPINPAVTVQAEMWNEPPWAPDASDNGRDLYDSATLGVTQSGTTLTVVTANSVTVGGNPSTYGLHVGDCLTGSGFPGYPSQECVTALGTGTGGTGTYTMSTSLTISSTTTVTTDPGQPHFQGNGPNFGMVAALQNATCAAHSSVAWSGTNKSGTPDVLNANMALYSGQVFTQPNPCVTFETLHPYGNDPEDAMYNWPKVQATPGAGIALNVLSQSTGNGYQVPVNTFNARTAHGSTYGINAGISETGTTAFTMPDTTARTRFTMRQYLGFMASNIQYLEFFTMFDLEQSGGVITSPGFSFITLLDNSTGMPCTSNATCLAATSYTVLPMYTALQGFMTDNAAIANPTVEAVTLPTVTGFSGGTYQLGYQTMTGARVGASHNSYVLTMWQISATLTGSGTFTTTTTSGSTALTLNSVPSTLAVGDPLSGPGIPANTTLTALSGTAGTMSAAATVTGTNVTLNYNRWQDLATPPAATATVTIPTGQSVTKVIDLVTRSTVPYTMSGSTMTIAAVQDNPVAVYTDPTAGTGTFIIQGPVTITGSVTISQH